MNDTACCGSGTVESAVRERYSSAAAARQESLCCPVTYRPELLSVIPDEILERDYGCGNPSDDLRPGETVVDLGSGGGKLCYLMSQLVGTHGRVIGVDCNRDMLQLARRHQSTIAERLGYANVEFRFGMIQDLRLDLELLEQTMMHHPVSDASGWLQLREQEETLRREQPMIPDASVDCVVSNCVLNLVRPNDRTQLFREICRVLKRGGRAVISDIVSDEDVPHELQRDPELWSGCVSGAWREDRFLQAFEDAGFHGIRLSARGETPWRVVHGIEFRSVTVVAWKGRQGPCLERNQAVIYRGPFRSVEDDDGHTYRRGDRIAVCDKTYHLLQQPPYEGTFCGVSPATEVPLEAAVPFDCDRSRVRFPAETKAGALPSPSITSAECCGSENPCC